jgi:hypothetical protein
MSGLTCGFGVRRQGLEPRTVALREPEGRPSGLRRSADIGSDLGFYLPLLSACDRALPSVRGPSAAHGRARGGHGRRAGAARSVTAIVTSSGDG